MTHDQAMGTFLALYTAYGLDAAVAGIAHTQNPPKSVYSPLIDAVCSHHGIERKKLIRGGKCRPLANARAEAMWMIREFGASYPAIGQALGGLNHTTVMAGVKKVNANPQLLEEARSILEMIRHLRPLPQKR